MRSLFLFLLKQRDLPSAALRGRVRGRELIKSDLESDFLRIRKRKSMKSECQKCWKQKSAINDESNGKEMRKLRILFQNVTIGEFY